MGASSTFSLPVNPVAENIPHKRFTEWTKLSDSDRTASQDSLGYSKYSWNNVGTNDIENWRYSDLYSDEAAAVDGLGIDSDQWDCHINHYIGYWWNDIENLGIDIYLFVLGWTEESWDHDGSKPESNDMYWNDLSAIQQEAARQLCYSEELWDVVPMVYWG